MNRLRAVHNIITTLMITGCQKHAHDDNEDSIIKYLLEDDSRHLNGFFPTMDYPYDLGREFFPHMKNWVDSYFSDQYQTRCIDLKCSQNDINESKESIIVNDSKNATLIATLIDGDFFSLLNFDREYRASLLSKNFEFSHFRILKNQPDYPNCSIENLPDTWYRGKISGRKFKVNLLESQFYGLIYSASKINIIDQELLLGMFKGFIAKPLRGNPDEFHYVEEFRLFTKKLIGLFFEVNNRHA